MGEASLEEGNPFSLGSTEEAKRLLRDDPNSPMAHLLLAEGLLSDAKRLSLKGTLREHIQTSLAKEDAWLDYDFAPSARGGDFSIADKDGRFGNDFIFLESSFCDDLFFKCKRAKEDFKKIESSLDDASLLQGERERIARARSELASASSFNGLALRFLGEGRVLFERIEDAYSRFRLAYFGWHSKKKWLKGSTIGLCSSLLALAVGAILWNTQESGSIAFSVGLWLYSIAGSATVVCLIIALFSLPGFLKKRKEKRNALKDIGAWTGELHVSYEKFLKSF